MNTDSFRIGSATHVGMIRTMNEDSYLVGTYVFAVADGMGGHLAGEVASSMAIDALSALDGDVTVDSVVGAIVQANQAILKMSRTDASRRGMGTTLTAVAVVHQPDGVDELAIVNLGDSRTYRFRNGRLEQVTVDHSYVQELVSGGHLSRDEARYHPQRNIVTRALGIEPQVGIDVWNAPIIRGDRYLLCSDGLVDEVTDIHIEEVLAQVDDPQVAADQLVDLANRSGGRDNVTVIVVDVLEGAEAPAGTDIPTSPIPIIGDDTLAVPRELQAFDAIDDESADESGDDESGERMRPAALATIIGDSTVDSTVDSTGAGPNDEPDDMTDLDDVTDLDDRTEFPPERTLTDDDTPTDAPMPTAAPTPPTRRRRTNIKLVAALGGLAVLAGIIVAATRDDSEPSPTTITTVAPTSAPASTTVPAPTTISVVPVTTAAPSPTGSGQPAGTTQTTG